MEDNLKKDNETKTMEIKINGCGTAPGNLVFLNYKESTLFVQLNQGSRMCQDLSKHVMIYCFKSGFE